MSWTEMFLCSSLGVNLVMLLIMKIEIDLAYDRGESSQECHVLTARQSRDFWEGYAKDLESKQRIAEKQADELATKAEALSLWLAKGEVE
jgi:hypothetical protein